MPQCPHDAPTGFICPTCGEFVPEKETAYPESSGSGDMLIRKEEPHEQPTDCMRVMLQKIRKCPTGKITFPGDVVTLMDEMKDMDRERAIIIHLSTKNNIIGVENISTGSLNASIVHPREAIKGSLLVNAAHIIFVHNHPSGDPRPSAEDMAINKKLLESFNIVGIDMLDAIIIGKNGYYSAKEHGELFPESKYSKYKESKNSEIYKIKQKKSGDRIMDKIGYEEDDACSTAMTAAMEVITERCSKGVAETNEPKEGKFLRLHLMQEINLIHMLALSGDSSVKFRAENAIKQIDIGVDTEMMSSEYAEVLRSSVQKASYKV